MNLFLPAVLKEYFELTYHKYNGDLLHFILKELNIIQPNIRVENRCQMDSLMK